MIEIKNLNKELSGHEILRDISLTVNPGEIVGLLGPNGAGKTTTMKIITGFWQPTAGTVKVGGLDVVKDALATKQKIGYLPENVPLYDEQKVFEYLKFVGQLRDIAADKLIGRIKEAAMICGLQDVIGQNIGQLSKGYRQRVGLAQAILHQPEVLILDEPTTGLDPNQIVQIRELIQKLGKEKTVLFSTHILSEVQAICDRVVIINQGKIVGAGKPQELSSRLAGGLAIKISFAEKNDSASPAGGAQLAAIKNLAGVTEVKFDNGGYKIIATRDVRADLFKLAVERYWVIMELALQETNLEDVFKQLTK